MKKIFTIFVVVLFVFIVSGCSTSLNFVESTNEMESETKKTESQSEQNDQLMDALRKCTVMEAADIYTTGVGKKTDNAFNDGRDTCTELMNQMGYDDFVDTVNTDWQNRQNEQIEGKPLSYYLDILGW